VRLKHVMNGYRADHYSQLETLVFMAFDERAHAVFCRNLGAQIEEPVLEGLIGKIARDEQRHEEFFANLVGHCLEYVRDETISAIGARAAELKVVGADINAYQDKLKNVAAAGIFDEDQLRRVISDRIKDWGVAGLPELSAFAVS
jgi:acyl-[acyl-carrier-protein] desaturase